ncbi:hypothetical protein [Pontimicrobium aquaticum]|uniref:Uncharacterized protein n=1 Tax=Pontimicrobium aquaticum TaxID=2565367 RepID=A0A4U0EKV2_9FLAO|nr:hypothetical protein [Pontimicrobium aquaticum]TJY31584.1 hypothetical protein E5167_15170 [Pontimicrobium aquaticum]
MYAKEIKLNSEKTHLATKVIEFDNDGNVINEKLIFEHDDFPDLPFGFDENNFPNGFSDEVSFEDSELINGEYVVERTGMSDETGNPYQRYFETTNKTFFNNKKQKIRVEENGKYENFIQTFEYDEDGFLIKENIDNLTNLFNYTERTNLYGKVFNDKLQRPIKLLKYTKLDDNSEIFYSYTRFGDLANISRIDNGTGITEEQFIYVYDSNGKWISKRHFENGQLTSIYEREYGDFAEHFKEEEDLGDLPF